MPQGSTCKEEREKSAYRCQNCHQDRPQARESGLDQGLLKGHARSTSLLNEVTQYDYMADDNASEADNTQKRHEPEGRMRHGKTKERADYPKWHGEHDCNRFHDRIELDDHDQRDQHERNLHDQSHLGTVLTQLFILAVKTEIVSSRQLNCRKTWPRTFQHSGAQLTKWRIGLHGNRA